MKLHPILQLVLTLLSVGVVVVLLIGLAFLLFQDGSNFSYCGIALVIVLGLVAVSTLGKKR